MNREEEKRIESYLKYPIQNTFGRGKWIDLNEESRKIYLSGMEWADSHPVNQWRKAEDELPPRKSEDSHQSLVVIVSDGFDFEKAYYDYFYGTWVGNNITPLYWIRLLKPEE